MLETGIMGITMSNTTFSAFYKGQIIHIYYIKYLGSDAEEVGVGHICRLVSGREAPGSKAVTTLTHPAPNMTASADRDTKSL